MLIAFLFLIFLPVTFYEYSKQKKSVTYLKFVNSISKPYMWQIGFALVIYFLFCYVMFFTIFEDLYPQHLNKVGETATRCLENLHILK